MAVALTSKKRPCRIPARRVGETIDGMVARYSPTYREFLLQNHCYRLPQLLVTNDRLMDAHASAITHVERTWRAYCRSTRLDAWTAIQLAQRVLELLVA